MAPSGNATAGGGPSRLSESEGRGGLTKYRIHAAIDPSSPEPDLRLIDGSISLGAASARSTYMVY